MLANKDTPVASCSDSSQAVTNHEGAKSSGTVALCIDSTGSQPEGRLMMGLEGFHLHLPCLTARQESRSSGVSTASKPRIPGKQKSLAVFAYKTIRVDRMSLGGWGTLHSLPWHCPMQRGETCHRQTGLPFSPSMIKKSMLKCMYKLFLKFFLKLCSLRR